VAKTRRAPVLTAALALGVVAVWSATGGGCQDPGRPAADGDGGARGGTRTFTDEIGRPVRPLCTPARRVISLAPNLTELLFALGAGDQVVGVDNYSDQPARPLTHIPKVGSDYEPSIEKMVALSPDVVFTSLSANRRETAEALERLGVPVFVTDTRSIVDVDRTLRSLGELTGHAAQAGAEIRRLHEGLQRVARRVAGRPRPRVLVVVWSDPLFVAGKRTFVNDLIEVAGGTNVASDVSGFSKYPLERVLRLLPDVIVLPTHSAPEQGPRAVRYWENWPELPAVRDRRVEAVEASVIIRPGPRLVEGAQLLARLLQPGIGTP